MPDFNGTLMMQNRIVIDQKSYWKETNGGLSQKRLYEKLLKEMWSNLSIAQFNDQKDKFLSKSNTILGKITKTNHEDVTYYKCLLHEYTKDILFVICEDFLEEITGHHIENKAFDNQKICNTNYTLYLSPTDTLTLRIRRSICYRFWSRQGTEEEWVLTGRI